MEGCENEAGEGRFVSSIASCEQNRAGIAPDQGGEMPLPKPLPEPDEQPFPKSDDADVEAHSPLPGPLPEPDEQPFPKSDDDVEAHMQQPLPGPLPSPLPEPLP